MIFPKLRPKVAILLVIVAGAAVIGFFVFRAPSSTPVSTPGSQTEQDTQQDLVKATQPADIETEDFKYQKPTGWVTLSKSILEADGANSGVVRTPAPTATFTVKVSSSTPSNFAELKDHALDDIKKNAQNFKLISSESTKVNAQASQKFIYTFDNVSYKFKQELSVAVYKQKTFFLLFSAKEADFDTGKAEYAQILASFKFK